MRFCCNIDKLVFIGEFEINSVVGATIGRPPKNGLKSMKRAADDRPYKIFVIAKLTDKSKFEIPPSRDKH